jgi:L,D-peptidoglycan transpeptidase YkuD (ErfK/YbiS/YcfS/YnhG family)
VRTMQAIRRPGLLALLLRGEEAERRSTMQAIRRPGLLALGCALALGMCAAHTGVGGARAGVASAGAQFASARAGVASAGARFAIPAATRQLIVVSSAGYEPPQELATLTAYERRGTGSPWRTAMRAMPAEIGYSGLSDDRREGDGSTPTGVYPVGARFFGNEPHPSGLHYPYVRLRCGDWWDEDPFSALYNRFVRTPCGTTPPFASGSEALWRETTAYPYFAVIAFNTGPVIAGAAAPGSGIFLHSWVNDPTAGCVAVHEAKLLALLRWLRRGASPRVAIGTTRELRGLP